MIRVFVFIPLVSLSFGCAESLPNIGASQCTSDAECDSFCADTAQQFGIAREGSVELTPSDCVQMEFIIGDYPNERSVSAGEVCECATPGTDGVKVIHNEEELGCVERGHAGHCLFSPSEFEGCQLGNAATCEDACSLLQSRIIADSQTTYDVEVVSSVCDVSVCDCEWRVDGECFNSSRVHTPCD